MKKTESFYFLDDEKIAGKIIDFKNEDITFVRFFIPSIHCSSCVLILENLSNIHKSILESTVDFSSKEVGITFNNRELRLSELALFLKNIGYKPSINFESLEKKKKKKIFDRKLIGKLAVSFFCFGNIMLLAIPEYIGGAKEDLWFLEKRHFFRYLMLILSLPIVFFSFVDHVQSAFLGIKKHIFNIDVPISIGVLVLFSWSCYEVFFDLGYGYFDSLAGFYFFLLISKMFQVHTHSQILSFEKNYKSFYPISVSKIKNNNQEENILLSSLKKGDIIIIRNEEIIPVDSILIKGNALLDNSFITGESYLIRKKIGERIYAGSKQKGEAICLKVIKEVDKSYLSLLWNKKRFRKKKLLNSISNKFSQYFTPIVLIISITTGICWFFIDPTKVFQTVFSVLIITCPCAVVLSAPFILWNIIRFFSKKGFYVKDIFTMERIATISTLIFDKTGTLTDPDKEKIFFLGPFLKDKDKKIIASLLRNSNHPLSKRIFSELSIQEYYSTKNFQEIIGKGMEGIVNNVLVKIGSPKYLGVTINSNNCNKKTIVAISMNKQFIGYFYFINYYRKGIEKIFKNLKERYKIIILSGDNNELEKKYLESILPKSSKILFNQSPEEKLDYVIKIQNSGEKVMMIGDGINDSSALNQSEVGISISEKPTSFFPNCDAFIQSNYLDKIFLFLKISRISIRLVMVNFMISLLYNFIGITFAITGHLRPFVAAVLMPLSSLSVITFSLLSTWLVYRRFIS
ncbi:cytochrome cbb3 oxidase maturation protein CcoI [Blattabacterium sp. (Mastotermes darwiniensis) str. MADAR]|uniref:heavy metal translocating P-type ATPase n=1 Tax=Blattabacterium sp. (Mastotermes darwiniensis) TaxID=39768 RepID=UPI000231DFB9|nr:HAD-IC family P-type ATPase [Blattabacterium sp. (Mastotermes darwiniensis)]AER40465.1 cytochrome cbb3 oxidase maturation protein CcoI [Blattabacterium sp. (Mastotermes darwiniensis) str. MADAR]